MPYILLQNVFQNQMKKNILFGFIIIITATSCSHKISSTASVTPKEEDSRPKVTLVKGQKYAVENKINTASTSEMQGQSMETNADITSVYNIEVEDVKDNTYSMTNKIAAIKMNMSTMGQNINFDSDKKEDMDGEMGSNLKDYINHPNPVVMDLSGKVIVQDKKDSTKNSASTPSEMMLKQMGDPEAQGYGAVFAFQAISKKAQPGNSWQDSTSKDGVTRVTNYTIKDIKKNIATVTVSGTETRDTKTEMQGMEIGTKTSGKFSGEETVDINTGVILQNNTTVNASGNITVMGQEIPTKVRATSVTNVKPL